MTHMFSDRAGFQGLWNRARGYFSADTMEMKGVYIFPSRKNHVCYFQVNWQRTHGFMCSEEWMQVHHLRLPTGCVSAMRLPSLKKEYGTSMHISGVSILQAHREGLLDFSSGIITGSSLAVSSAT
jgi:hypothetical protein